MCRFAGLEARVRAKFCGADTGSPYRTGVMDKLGAATPMGATAQGGRRALTLKVGPGSQCEGEKYGAPIPQATVQLLGTRVTPGASTPL